MRERRKAAKMTLEVLATACEVSAVYLSDIERGGRQASIETGARIALALDIHLDLLYYSRGELPPDLPVDAAPERVRLAFSVMRRALLWGDAGSGSAQQRERPDGGES